MKEITYSIPYSDEYKIPEFITAQCSPENLLFFDIETTGFSAKNTTLYLIGVLYYREDCLHIIQWFNKTGNCEKEVLDAFQTFSKNFSHLIHFNGLGFDLPYLRQKANLLKTPFSIDNDMIQIDIFKEIRAYKNILRLENMKQVTIEQYLGITRLDTYNGGDLIHIYQRYVATASKDLEELLLLHNHDDLLGMPKVCEILNYCSFFRSPEITDLHMELSEGINPSHTHKENSLHIYFNISQHQSLKNRILYQFHGIYLNIADTKGYLSIPVSEGSFFHFFKDYQNYYYLPFEDMAIHKSVATYVDPANRIKANKNNCYVKKQDLFIPYDAKEKQLDIFYSAIKDKQKYIQLNSLLSADTDTQKTYIKNMLQKML